MEQKLDKKFVGEIKKIKDGSVVPPDQWFVFLVKDNAFALYALPRYLEACKELNCDRQQIELVEQMLDNATQWRSENKHLCKNPDAAGEKVLG